MLFGKAEFVYGKFIQLNSIQRRLKMAFIWTILLYISECNVS